jgi:putative ABC transport system permease protein
VSLALATLIYEWRRYLAAIIALAFSGLLVLAQIGMFAGIVHSVMANVERAPAQVIILPPKTESLINSDASLPARIQPQIYLNPNVVEVAAMDRDDAKWVNVPAQGQKQVQQFVDVIGVDLAPGSATLPADYPDATRIALQEPMAVAVDASALTRLGARLGDTASVNGKTVTLRAVLHNYQNVNNVEIITARDTMRALGLSAKPDKTGPLMVRLVPGADAGKVRDQLNAVAAGGYHAWTNQDLSKANEKALLSEQIIGVLLSFSVFLAILIGVGITSQTLRGAILSNIKEFASLRALGISMGSLRVIVVELSFWVGVAGLVATGALTAAIGLLASAVGLPMVFAPTTIAWVCAMLMFIAMASGVMAMGILKKSQPADLLR